MTQITEKARRGLEALQTADGSYSMVALDHREVLREMFPPVADGVLVSDQVLQEFKREAIEILSPHASGMLLDNRFGIPNGQRPAELQPNCGLILAADALTNVRGVGVTATSVDPRITVDYVRETQAVALKLLVLWHGGRKGERDLVDQFLDLAEQAGVESLVEGVVRLAPGESWRDLKERDEAILDVAEALSKGASLYKAQVPGYTPGDVSRVRASARELSEIVAGPWVILSNGVAPEDFPEAVAESCAGGASGFLAGRSVWADTVVEVDPRTALRERAAPRLQGLAELVSAARHAL
ncbi:hypothetical protein [Humibacter sp.]|uniref:hypothetical protein n=1 Tax=Humibacter sp. TaxID=1940291 RepID=UPI002C339673|nr:hypothetical protein [Humibacter sp.]HVX06716.1 hypothetical protein [Humibacter sp.]